MTRRNRLPILLTLGLVTACATVHPTANELLNDPAAKLEAPGATVTRTYAANGHKGLTSSDRSSVALEEVSTATPNAVSAYYDTKLLALGWARDCRASLSLSTDGPSTGYGWTMGTRQLALTVFAPASGTKSIRFKVGIRVSSDTGSSSGAASSAGVPLAAC